MKQYQPNDHRNVALIGHGGSGKTSLAEALLFRAKATSRLGSVADGSSVLDHLPEEVKRGGSIALAAGTFEYGGKKITLLDTPGFPDFAGEMAAGLHAAGAAVLVVSADAGVEVGTELTWRRCRSHGMAAAIVINGMDKEQADPEAALASVREKISAKVVPMQIPMGAGDAFTGVVDILHDSATIFGGDDGGKKGPVPDEYKTAVEEARAALMENAAESSEAMMNKYFEEGELSQEELVSGIHVGIAQGDLYPVFYTSASTAHGMSQLLDMIADIFPGSEELPPAKGVHPDTDEPAERPAKADGPLTAQVFKTTSEQHVGEIFFVKVYSGMLKAGAEVHNSSSGKSEKMSQLFQVVGKNRKEVEALTAGDIGIAVKLRNSGTSDTLCDRANPIRLEPIDFPPPVIDFAIHTTGSGDEDKMGTGLQRLAAEDRTFTFRHDEETHQTIVGGLGEAHLEMMMAKLKERYGVTIEMEPPRIPYRETIRGSADVQGRHKKQSGGRGQFGDVFIKMAPAGQGEGFVFENKIVGGAIPGRFIPAVQKGIEEASARGVIAGYPMVDFQVTLYDGSFHTVDSSEAAFKVAGSIAFKKAVLEAKPTILEPFLAVKIVVPKDYMGDVMGDLSSRRGKIQGMDAEGEDQVINAQVPAGEMLRYAMDLRSMTQGRGVFEKSFSHYEELPRELQEKVIATSKLAAVED